VTGTEELTAAALYITQADDAPEALAELFKKYPMADPAVRTWVPETDAFVVLLRAWMTANPGTALELTLRKLEYEHGGCVFVKRNRSVQPLPTDFLVETILAATQVDNTNQSLGLDGRMWKLFDKIYIPGRPPEPQVQVLLTAHSLIIGGRVIWQR